MKVYFDDLTVAYKTLVNKVSREEYDLYISQNQIFSYYWENYWKEKPQEAEDSE